MPFSLVGKFQNEAIDSHPGVRLKSRGARGPEIERQIWAVEISGQEFEFETYILGEERDGIQEVLLSPSRQFIEYIDDHTALTETDRMKLLRNIVEGLYFIFPTYFRAPFRFRKSYPIAAQSEAGQMRFGTIHGRVWDAADLGPPD